MPDHRHMYASVSGCSPELPQGEDDSHKPHEIVSIFSLPCVLYFFLHAAADYSPLMMRPPDQPLRSLKFTDAATFRSFTGFTVEKFEQ
eukprot:2997558-Amphidinium_carterae.4